MPMHKVAVYGSLKAGKGNHRLLSESVLLGTGVTESLYKMISFGSFPGIINDPVGFKVQVEVYEVNDSTLSRLDGLEGHPHFYRRSKEKVMMDSGDTVDLEIYILNRSNDSGNTLFYIEPVDGVLEW